MNNNIEIVTNQNPKTGIEFTVLDINKKEKKVLMFFDSKDDWFKIDNPTEHDILSMFAGCLMNLFKKDQETNLIQAQPFSIKNNSAKKMCGTFTPQVKVNGEFKSCYIHKDGSIEIL